MFKRILLLLLLGTLLYACTTIGPQHSDAIVDTEDFSADVKAGETNSAIENPVNNTSIGTAKIEPTITPTPTQTPIPATYFNFPQGINPLTGLEVADPKLLDRRPVMVKVSNWPRLGRPHAGLTSADIVFEYYIGYQMNRFLAVYYGDNADVIGPVRSGRFVDAQLVSLYQGLLAYGDADPQVDRVLVDVLGDRALTFSELPCPPMCGQTTHSATGVFADSGAMTDYAVRTGVDNTAPDLRGIFFQGEVPEGNAKGELLRVEYADFSIMEWHYHPETNKYRLWQEMDTASGLDLLPMTDRNNGRAVAFDNLIVMYAEYIEYAPSLHDIVVQNVFTPQPALFFRDGVLTYGTWRTPDPERPIIFENYDGEVMPLKPGKTWVVIVGLNSSTVQAAGGEWEIEFGLP